MRPHGGEIGVIVATEFTEGARTEVRGAPFKIYLVNPGIIVRKLKRAAAENDEDLAMMVRWANLEVMEEALRFGEEEVRRREEAVARMEEEDRRMEEEDRMIECLV